MWRFRSDVLRDVAYDSLAKRERERLHVRVADKLSAPEFVGRYPRTIAFHLEQAARAGLDLHPNDRTLADRAVDALTKAGDAARRKIESRAAVDLYERALVARRAGGRVGRSRGVDRRHARRGALLAGRLRRGRDSVPQGDDAGRGRRSCRRACRTLPGGHHLDDPGRRSSRREPVRPVARRRAPAWRPVRPGAHAADGGLGPVLAAASGRSRGAVPRGARGDPRAGRVPTPGPRCVRSSGSRA